MDMTRVQAILHEAGSLSAGERAELLAELLQQTAEDAASEDVAVGQRGLAAWTEAAGDESWAEFYPDTFRNRQGQAR